jgi:hypothetical protein
MVSKGESRNLRFSTILSRVLSQGSFHHETNMERMGSKVINMEQYPLSSYKTLAQCLVFEEIFSHI